MVHAGDRTYDTLLAAVLAEPEDWDRRRILADYLEERGDYYGAECLRWSADHKKRPRYCSAWGRYSIQEQRVRQWYVENRIGGYGRDPSSDLPTVLFSRLSGFYPTTLADRKDYTSLEAAELALVQAWRDMRVAGESVDQKPEFVKGA